MKQERINIWEDGEYNYPAAYGFMPNIRTYIHEDDTVRDCMLVVPGGGYCMVVPPEAGIVAKEFYDRGMNAFVLTYTTDITMSVPLKMQPLLDIDRAVRIIRAGHEAFKINPDRLFVCGFSAGAHVCGSLCTHFEDIEDNSRYKNVDNRPTGAILSYPVITTGPMTHIYSVQALLGKEPTQEELEYFSLEKNVDAHTPPCFIWQTRDDNLVPVENSYLMAESLKAAGVNYAHYVFPSGFHGLSIPTDEFFRGEFDNYTCEQLDATLPHIKNHTAINVSPERYEELMQQFFGQENDGQQDETAQQENDGQQDESAQQAAEAAPQPNPADFADVRMWPELAMNWMKKIR